MSDLATATTFLHTLNSAHTSVKFTMEVEKNGKLPFLGTELLNHAPRIETKVYVKPTNTGLLLHYQSHVDNRYKGRLLTTMLDHAHPLSSSWAYFSEECDRLKKVFAPLTPSYNQESLISTPHRRPKNQEPLFVWSYRLKTRNRQSMLRKSSRISA